MARPVRSCPKAQVAWHIDTLISPYVYAAPLYRQLHALKFHGARTLGRALGLLLAAELMRLGARADALLAVPLYPKRLRERGYNQAQEIARTVAAELGIRLLVHGAGRTRPTIAQSTLGSAARSANVAGAFTADRRSAGMRIAVVDDVVTTGATVNAVAAALRGAGAAAVQAWAVARTPDRPFRRSGAEQVIEQHAGEDRAA